MEEVDEGEEEEEQVRGEISRRDAYMVNRRIEREKKQETKTKDRRWKKMEEEKSSKCNLHSE